MREGFGIICGRYQTLWNIWLKSELCIEIWNLPIFSSMRMTIWNLEILVLDEILLLKQWRLSQEWERLSTCLPKFCRATAMILKVMCGAWDASPTRCVPLRVPLKMIRRKCLSMTSLLKLIQASINLLVLPDIHLSSDTWSIACWEWIQMSVLKLMMSLHTARNTSPKWWKQTRILPRIMVSGYQGWIQSLSWMIF